MLLTRKEMAALMSISGPARSGAHQSGGASTHHQAPPSRSGFTASSGSYPERSQATPHHQPRELRRTEEGIGPSIRIIEPEVSGSGALAHRPAMIASKIKLSAGVGVAVAAPGVEGIDVQLPANGRQGRSIQPALIRSPTRLVRKAIACPFTTSDWLNQVPTIQIGARGVGEKVPAPHRAKKSDRLSTKAHQTSLNTLKQPKNRGQPSHLQIADG